MKTDNNWLEIKDIANDLDTLIGAPPYITEEYLKLLENLIIHRFLEKVSDLDFTGKDCQIELPYLGTLIVSADEKNKLSLDFSPRNSFYKKLKDAYYNRESPLISQLGEILGEALVDKLNGREDGDNDE